VRRRSSVGRRLGHDNVQAGCSRRNDDDYRCADDARDVD
jgi:hypothetical protein